MSDNNFLINLIASLQKSKSKKQVQSDAKNLGDIKVPLVGTLNKAKTRAQLKKDLSGVTGTVEIDTKINQKNVAKSTQQAQKQVSSTPIQMEVSLKKDKLVNDIKILGQQNSKLFKDTDMSTKYSKLLNSAQLATSSKDVQNLRLQLSAMRSELKATGLAGLNLGDTLKKTFRRATELFTGTGGMMLAIQQLRQAWTEALQLDKSYTDLIKVQDELSRSDYPDYLDKVNEKAQKLATTQNELIEAVTEFSKVGYDLNTSDALAEQATILANVGDMEASFSAKAIISGVQAYDTIDGYDDVINKAQALIDKYNEIGNTASITTAEIAQAIQSVGSVLADSNTSVDQIIGLLSAGNRQFQDADSLALGLRTSALRIRGASAELEALGEDTEGVITSVSKLEEKIKGLTNIDGSGGIQLLEADGKTFRSIYDIYVDIGKVYKQMSDIDQSALLDLIAGKNRASAISATLNNMAEAQEVYQNSLNSTGSAQKEYDKYLESADASLNRFKANMTEAYQSIINGETAKGILDTGNAVVSFSNSMGLVESTLKGFVAIGIIKAITTLSTAFKASAIQASNFGTALNTVKSMSTMAKGTAEYTNALSSLKTISGSLSATQLKQVLASEALSNADRIAILRTTGLTKAQAEAKLMQMGLSQTTKATTAANAAATASTFSLSSAVKGLGLSLKAAFLSNPITISIMALTTVIGAVSTSIAKYNQEVEETRQANIDASNTASDSAKTLSELYLKYQKLNDIQSKTSSQEEEFKSVIDDITTSLGNKNSVLKDLTTGTDEYTNALKEATKAELESQYSTVKIGAKAAEDVLKEDLYNTWDGSQVSIQMNENMTGVKEHVAALDEVRSVLSKYEKYTSQGSKWEPVDVKNVKSGVEYYNALLEAREKLVTSEDADYLMSSDIYKDINTTINNLSESVETYTEQEYEALKLNYLWQNGIPSTKEEFDKMEKSILSAADAGKYFSDSIKDYLSQDYSDLEVNIDSNSGDSKSSTENSKTSFLDKTTEIDDFQSKVESLSKTLESLKNGNLTDSDLVDLLQEFPELTGKTDDLQSAIKSLINNSLLQLLDELGSEVPDELKNSLENIANEITNISDTDTISSAISSIEGISDAMSVLDQTYATLISNDDKIDFSDLTSLNETFGDLDNFENFASVISNTASTAEQVQQAFNDLTTEYINNSGALDNLTLSTADFVVQALKEMGVANAEEYVYAQLGLTIDQYSQLKAIATQRGIDLMNITYQEVQALVNEKQVTDETANVLYTYALQKKLANENVLSTSSDIQNLQALVTALGATTTAIDLYNNMKRDFAANPILPGAGSGIHEDARDKALGTAKSNALAEAQAALDDALNSTTSLSNTAPTIDYTGGAKTADAMEQNLKDAEDAASAAEDALKSAYDAYVKLMSHEDVMGIYENDPMKYVERLGELVTKYVYDQETAWDAEEKIYQAREKYLDEWVSKASDVYADLLDMLDTYQTQLQNKITLSNDNASKSTYITLFKSYVTEAKKYAEERDYLQQELSDYLAKGGKKGDDRWTELTQKIADANTKIDETKLALRDLVDEYRDKWLDAIEDVYSRQISALEKYTDRLQDLYDLTGDSKYLTEMGTNYQDTLNEYITKKNYVQSQMDKQLKSGLISTDPTDGEAYQGYLTLLDTLNGLDDSINSVKKSIKALADTSLENWMDSVTELGSEAISLIDDYKSQLKSYISEIESAGGIVGNSLYEALITSTSQEMDAYTSRLNSLKQQLQNGLDNGLIEKYDENWQKLVASINETAQAITDTQSEINEFNTALMQLDFSKFDTLLSRLSSISSELDNILSTIDQVNTKLVDESATLTSDGLATIALNLQQREVGIYNLSQLKEEIAKLQEQYKAGTYDMSEEEYLERLAELQSEQYSWVEKIQEAESNVLD